MLKFNKDFNAKIISIIVIIAFTVTSICKTWIKIIAVALIIVFIVHDLAWAKEIASEEASTGSSRNDKNLHSRHGLKHSTLRPAMMFANKDTIDRYLEIFWKAKKTADRLYCSGKKSEALQWYKKAIDAANAFHTIMPYQLIVFKGGPQANNYALGKWSNSTINAQVFYEAISIFQRFFMGRGGFQYIKLLKRRGLPLVLIERIHAAIFILAQAFFEKDPFFIKGTDEDMDKDINKMILGERPKINWIISEKVKLTLHYQALRNRIMEDITKTFLLPETAKILDGLTITAARLETQWRACELGAGVGGIYGRLNDILDGISEEKDEIHKILHPLIVVLTYYGVWGTMINGHNILLILYLDKLKRKMQKQAKMKGAGKIEEINILAHEVVEVINTYFAIKYGRYGKEDGVSQIKKETVADFLLWRIFPEHAFRQRFADEDLFRTLETRYADGKVNLREIYEILKSAGRRRNANISGSL